MKNKIIKNIPNALTISRIIASIGGAGAFVTGNISLAIGLYVYGAGSDCFDGFAARKLNAFSEFGRKLDAFSDKIYAGSLLIPSIVCGNLVMLISLLLELKISYITLKSEKLGFKPETQRIGKFKTVFLFPTMITGLLSTIFINLYPLLLVLLPLTTILQSKSITVYENLLNYNINSKRINELKKEDVIEDINLLKNIYKDNNYKNVVDFGNEKEKDSSYSYNNKSMNILDELAFYIMTPCFKQNYDNDEISYKKLSKKKQSK